MTERQDVDPFEARFAEQIHTYTDRATVRRIDALAVSRAAMALTKAGGRWRGWPGFPRFGARIATARIAVALAAVVLVGAVGVAFTNRPSNSATGPRPSSSSSPSATGPAPDVLRHAWQRPYGVTPDLGQWGSGTLTVTDGVMEFGSDTGAATSRTAIAAAGSDALVATATVETRGCAVGDAGTYRWSVEGKATVMTLTADGKDACAAREQSLAGQWVRADLPQTPNGVPMQPGTYLTAAFSPFDAPETQGQLSYTVPERWKVKEDRAAIFLLHHLAADAATDGSGDVFIHLFTQPRLVADYVNGAACGPTSEVPGVGTGVDDLVAAIIARPGVESTTPSRITVGGYQGEMVDLHLAASWSRGCRTPDASFVALPLLLGPDFEIGANFGIGPNSPARLILLDLTGGRTIAIAVFKAGPAEPSQLEADSGEAMRVIESFEFHPPSR
jgi:hypothetical protein